MTIRQRKTELEIGNLPMSSGQEVGVERHVTRYPVARARDSRKKRTKQLTIAKLWTVVEKEDQDRMDNRTNTNPQTLGNICLA